MYFFFLRKFFKGAKQRLFHSWWQRKSCFRDVQCHWYHCHNIWKWYHSWNSGMSHRNGAPYLRRQCNLCVKLSLLQATIAPPVKGKMFKGLCFCYAVLGVTFFSVAISGYWAFGNQSGGLILGNFLDGGKPLVPKWFIFTTNFLVILQQSAIAAVRISQWTFA